MKCLTQIFQFIVCFDFFLILKVRFFKVYYNYRILIGTLNIRGVENYSVVQILYVLRVE